VRRPVTVRTVQEWARANSVRYVRASKAQKKQLVDEFQATCAGNRRYLQQLLRHPPPPRKGPVKRPRARRYGDDVRRALEQVWKHSDRLCSRRLVPFLGEWVPRLERFGHLALGPATREKLLALSVSTADRLLKAARAKEGVRGRSTTQAGTLLKHQIAVRTFADWEEDRPGFFEVDLVAHCGDSIGGEFLHTLTLTDVNTQWTECVPLVNRSQRAVCEAIDGVRKRLSFAVLGIDSDNGSEFINESLKSYCELHQITFTRSRPYKKNDQCRVEQKNGQIVRRYVGYLRHESREELEALRKLYRALRHWQNYFQPSMKLLSKERNGARVKKTYDTALTPYQRLIGSDALSKEEKDELQQYYDQLDPVEILAQIEAAQDELCRAWKVRFSREATNAP